ncbi:MAG: Lrp/AsnC family transcriptional regulator [Pseudomonadota bacterium]
MFQLDDIDRKILRALQENADATIAEIAERAGVSQTPCWKRIKKLEASNVIKKRVALLDPSALGLALVGYVRVRTNAHTQEWTEEFAKGIRALPEITECHRMTGDVDYLLKVVIADMDDYDRVYKKLIKIADLADVSVNFSMERLKETTELPL